jgi:glutathione-regulated potassium-efflux system ancillary protein KefC
LDGYVGLAGVALSTTSVAVVYAVMLELGLNKTEFGKAILAACFINDLGTVIALGLIFSPFTIRTVIFVVVSAVVFLILPFLTPRFFKHYGGRVYELEAKYLLFLLFGMGGLAVWSGSEAVLPPTSSEWCSQELSERITYSFVGLGR